MIRLVYRHGRPNAKADNYPADKRIDFPDDFVDVVKHIKILSTYINKRKEFSADS